MTPIPLWLNLILLVCLPALATRAALGVAAQHPEAKLETVLPHARYLLWLVIAIAPLVGLHVMFQTRPDWSWGMPDVLEYRYMAIVWSAILVVFCFLFAFSTAFAWKTHHPEWPKLLFASALLVGAVEFSQWHFTRLIANELTEDRTPSGVILQTHGSSCAAASAANMAHQLGAEFTEQQMAVHLQTTMMGTSAAQVVYGMSEVGFECKKAFFAKGDSSTLTYPAMLFVDHPLAGPESHAVAAVEGKDGKIAILDPLKGRSDMTPEALAGIWHGRAVLCTRR